MAIDLYCGLGGWAEGLLAEGWDVVGFDIERHRYPARVLPESGAIKQPGRALKLGKDRPIGAAFNYGNEVALRDAPLIGGWFEYPAQLVLQDVLTLHGSQFRDADLIVASPPCQEYSYMAMPWTRAKAKAAAIEADTTGKLLADLNRLFMACFRIQREACEAAGRHVPLIVENVRGAQKWVGRARWNFGSYYLWGDVPALMPPTRIRKIPTLPTIHCGRDDGSLLANIVIGDGVKGAHGTSGSHWTNPAERDGLKNAGFRFDGSIKHHGSGPVWFDTGPAALPSSSPRRKAASALIAKIPLPLARHIARTFRPGVA